MRLHSGIYIVPTDRWYIERTVWLFAGVPDLQTYLTHGVPHGYSTEDRWGWFVKRDQEAVACGGDFPTAEASELSADCRVVALE